MKNGKAGSTIPILLPEAKKQVIIIQKITSIGFCPIKSILKRIVLISSYFGYHPNGILQRECLLLMTFRKIPHGLNIIMNA